MNDRLKNTQKGDEDDEDENVVIFIILINDELTGKTRFSRVECPTPSRWLLHY